MNDTIKAILNEAQERILRTVQNAGAPGWERAVDADGNPNTPSDERQVLVFLWGGQPDSEKRPDDAGHGLRIGYFDHDKQFWRVHGSPERYVTHWREEPAPPQPEAQA